tara:strand:+ start:83 stop:409 length:327 start_codon:yes stop_codon:yes gene_type:complete
MKYLIFIILFIAPVKAETKYYWQSVRHYLNRPKLMIEACKDMKEENDIGTSAFEIMYMPTLPDRLWLAIGKRDSYWADDSKEGSILFTREGVLNLKKFIAEKSCPNIF